MKCHLIKRGRLYSMRLRLNQGDPLENIPLKLSDKQSAEKRMKEIAAQRQREALGILPPAPLVAAAQKPLLQHVEDYVNDLTTAGRNFRYVKLVALHLKHLLKECGWALSKDVTADAFEKWRSANRDKSAKTMHEYLSDASTFFRWMENRGRIAANPLKMVSRVELRGKEKIKRRAFSLDELRRLQAVSGRRWVVYLTAVTTGIRRGELEALEWGDFQIDQAPYSVRIRACISKNKRSVDLPLMELVAEELRKLRPDGVAPGAKVFKGWMPKMERFKKDLEAACIPFINERGHRADFHALRGTLATNLLNAGVPLRVAMEWMRHSDPKLTTKTYYDERQTPLSDAVGKLTAFLGDSANGGLSPRLSPVLVNSGQNLSTPGKSESPPEAPKPLENKGDCHALAQADNACQVAYLAGVEPATPRSVVWCSIQLSYRYVAVVI